MENVLFKISYPAEFHAQTAVEAAMTLRGRMLAAGKSPGEIASIALRTHEACLRIIDKAGPLSNPADRDHCVQYMVAVPLLFGRLLASDYEDAVASDARIDTLRAKMTCIEDPAFTADYLDPAKRSIANTLTLAFDDGSTLTETVEYPIGHRRRRAQGIPLLEQKFRTNLARRFSPPTGRSHLGTVTGSTVARVHTGPRVRRPVHGLIAIDDLSTRHVLPQVRNLTL